MQTFPSVKDVAWELRALNSSSDGKAIAILQVFEDGKWWVHDISGSVDSDEKYYCAQAEVPGCIGPHKKPRKINFEEVARQLIDEVKKQYAKQLTSKRNVHHKI